MQNYQRPRISYVRGADLNPWQLHAFRALGTEFELLAVGSKSHHFENVGLPMQARKGWGLGGLRVPSFLRGLRRWFGRDKIFGLEKMLQGSALVHTVDLAAGYSEQSGQFCRSNGVRLVCTIYENVPFVHEEIPRLRRRKQFLREQVDLFLPVTERAARTLVLEGVDPERIQVLGPGVDLEHFHPSVAPTPRGLPLPPDSFRVLYAGRLVPEKGILYLLWACRELQRKLGSSRPVHLLLAGSGPDQARIVAAAARVGFSDRVHFLGYVPYAEVPGLYTYADCLVLPSLFLDTWHEQYGLVLAEAMASGCPVLGSDCGSIVEVMGPSGLPVPPGDFCVLADQLHRLATDALLARRLGTESREWAERTMDARAAGAALADVYRKLTG